MDKATKIKEARSVKAMLKSEGILNARVRHEGGWLNIEVAIDKPSNCFCKPYDNRCTACTDTWSSMRNHIIASAKQVTGRDGSYNGYIQSYIYLK
tara:strand:+ start:317 stop:601 length:285 start_codon:yes stop_codon:yes gene_type:complete